MSWPPFGPRPTGVGAAPDEEWFYLATARPSGERWSARKLLRRALWHEQDHAAEIGRAIVDA